MRILAVMAICMGAWLLAACSSGVTSAQVSQIKNGMKVDQVTGLLGQPTNIEQAETTGATGQVYYYNSDRGTGKIVFVNDLVFHAEFIPRGASS